MKQKICNVYFQMTFVIILFSIVTVALYPFCKYYIDPDTTAYLTIIERYANGEYFKAFNGLWSPLHPFISGTLMRFGSLSAYAAALYVNVGAGFAVLILTFKMFAKFRKSTFERWLFGVFSALYWAMAVYFQLVADLLGLAIMLYIIICINNDDFLYRKRKWLLVGVLGGILVYAKTYNFYASILIIMVYLFYLNINKVKSLKSILYMVSYIFIPMILLSLPLVYFTKVKYGIWAFGLTGKLNLDWFTVGTQVFRDDIRILIPPPYPDSVSYWEDPFWVQGGWHGIFSEMKYFFRYLLRLAYNFTSWIKEMNHLSFFYSITWILSAFLFFPKQKIFFRKKIGLLILVSLLYPVGLWLVAIEARYLWLTLVPVMILGLYLYDWKIKKHLNKISQRLFLIIFFCSYLVGMIGDIRLIINNGKKEFEIAQILIDKNIQGSFMCNKAAESGALRSIQTLAYFSGNPFYMYPREKWTLQELLADGERYSVSYFYYFYDGLSSGFTLLDSNGDPFPELTENEIPGLLIFDIKK